MPLNKVKSSIFHKTKPNSMPKLRVIDTIDDSINFPQPVLNIMCTTYYNLSIHFF